jgi:uncharacterized GH25 family protein
MRPSLLLCLVALAHGLTTGALAAARTVTFAGRVVDAGGKPAGGATVYVRFWDTPLTMQAPDLKATVRQTTSAPDGSFRLPVRVSQAEWWVELSAAKQGHGPGGQILASPAPTTGLVIALTRPSFVAGQVVDRAGRRVVGAKLSVRYAQRPNWELARLPPEEMRPPATTDAQGHFRLAPVPAGCRITLEAEHPEYARWSSSPGERVASGTDDFTITLAPAGAFVARVVTEDGRPAPNVTVRCGGFWSSPPPATTDATGTVRFGNLVAGTYVVTAMPPGESPALVADPQGVEVREGAEARCPDLRLVPGGLVTGTVRNEQGRPMPCVDLMTVRQLHLPRLQTVAWGPGARTGADGAYRLRLPAGEWHVCLASSPSGYLFDPQWQNYPARSVAAGQTTHAEFTLRRAVVTRLRVLDIHGKPAAGATMERGFGSNQTADAAGRCTISRVLANGAESLMVYSRDGAQGALVPMAPAASGAVTAGGERVVRLQRLPALKGVVEDPSGRPLPDAWVNADRMVPMGGGMSGRMPEPVKATTTDGRGRFVLPLFPGTQYRISAEAPGYGAADRFPVQPVLGKSGAPLRFTLWRADGAIAGVVLDPDGKPLPGARVAASRGGATGVHVVYEETTTDPQGRFRVRHLPPGDVSLVASREGYFADRREKARVGAANVELLLAPSDEAPPGPPAPRVGASAPELRIGRWVNGEGVPSMSTLRGKSVVLQFSTAYNRAAHASNEALKALHARLREAGRSDVVILAVYDASATAEEVASYAREEGLPFPIGLVEGSRNLGADSAAFQAYGVRQLPTVFVIDREGAVRAINPTAEELTRVVDVKAGD